MSFTVNLIRETVYKSTNNLKDADDGLQFEVVIEGESDGDDDENEDNVNDGRTHLAALLTGLCTEDRRIH